MVLDTNHTGRNGHSIQSEQLPMTVDYPKLLELGRELLVALGENPEREGLRETPRRWADTWREFIEYDPGMTETCFEFMTTDQIVCVSGIRIASYCEHHVMPFWCDVALGYMPCGKVIGLSKFARIAHQFAHCLQIQERLGQQMADEVSRISGTAHVAAILKGQHLCMATRGIRTPGTMTSSAWRGLFATESERRMEFLRMISWDALHTG